MLILSFITSLGISLITVPLIVRLAKRFGFVDDPKEHKHPAILHKQVIPRAGGVPIFLAVFISTLLFLDVNKSILGILFGGYLLILIGLLDDKYDLNNYLKLFGQILAACLVVGSGVGINFITNPFYFLGIGGVAEVIRLDTTRLAFDFFGTHSIVVWADLFAVFWIVWVMNMVNFSAGVDGQLPGIVIVALLVIFLASLRFIGMDVNQANVAGLAIIGVGATLGFLVFNFSPAKIFPGDSGSYFLGFLVAVCAILSGAKVGAAILVMAVPLVDGVFTVMRRLISLKSPFKGDRTHLHHRLLELGLTVRQVALFYWLLCAILGSIALLLPAGEKVFAAVVTAVVIIGGLLWLNMNLPTSARK